MNRDEFRFAERLRVRWAEIDAQQIVFNDRQGAVLVTGEVVYVIADAATQTSKQVPQALRATLESYEAGGKAGTGVRGSRHSTH